MITPKHMTILMVCMRKLGKRMTEVTELGTDEDGEPTLTLAYANKEGGSEQRTYKMEGQKVKKLGGDDADPEV